MCLYFMCSLAAALELGYTPPAIAHCLFDAAALEFRIDILRPRAALSRGNAVHCSLCYSASTRLRLPLLLSLAAVLALG